jgi:hypothetical protein
VTVFHEKLDFAKKKHVLNFVLKKFIDGRILDDGIHGFPWEFMCIETAIIYSPRNFIFFFGWEQERSGLLH